MLLQDAIENKILLKYGFYTCTSGTPSDSFKKSKYGEFVIYYSLHDIELQRDIKLVKIVLTLIKIVLTLFKIVLTLVKIVFTLVITLM